MGLGEGGEGRGLARAANTEKETARRIERRLDRLTEKERDPESLREGRARVRRRGGGGIVCSAASSLFLSPCGLHVVLKTHTRFHTPL